MKKIQSADRRSNLLANLLGGTALATAMTLTGAAVAQTSPGAVEEVVVTGTSIRGAAPVGANVISVNREEIESTGAQTVQQLLRSVPQVTGFNNTGQGGFGSADGSGTNAPTIHSLGASASNQTLVLIDGHRLPLTGLNHTLADPSVIPPIALQQVEVLPDGSSAIYGSDAVAGVLNFITRRNFTGWETSAQGGVGDGYKTANVGFVFGHNWDSGQVLLAYGGSYRSELKGDSRDYYKADQRDRGGGNFASFNCFPSAVRVGGATGTIYQGTYTTGSGQAGNTPAFCDTTRVADILPQEVRNSVLAKIEQDVSENLRLSADLVFSERVNKSRISRGVLTNATVFGPGAGQRQPGQPVLPGTGRRHQRDRQPQLRQLARARRHEQGGAEDLVRHARRRLQAAGRVAGDVRRDLRRRQQLSEPDRPSLRALRPPGAERHRQRRRLADRQRQSPGERHGDHRDARPHRR